MKLSHKILKLFISIVLIIPLAGCFKGELFIDIHPNGSATFAGSYGLNSQAKMLLGMQGQNIEEQFFDPNSDDESIRTSRWVEGEYEWVKYERDLQDFDEVNNTLNQGDLFNHFSLTRTKGLFQNQYILDAEIDFSPSDGTTTDPTGMSASNMIDFRFLARMPGTIQGNNGLMDINDPNLLIWTINIDGVTPIYAKSVTWNYLNIGLMAGVFLLLAILAIVLIVFLVLSRNKSRAVSLQDLDLSDSSVKEKE